MQIAKDTFQKSYNRVLEIHSLYKHLESQGFPFLFISDLLRSEIVYIVSALDRFIHDIVKIGIIEIFNGQRIPTNSYYNQTITFREFDNINNPAPDENVQSILEQIIINSNKHISFQDPDKISQGLSLIWNVDHKWQRISTIMGIEEKTLKRRLKNIIIRRNQIVHEADIDIFSNEPQVLTSSDTEEMVNFINVLTETIYNEIKK